MLSLISPWNNFYIVVATCAGGLIGLQFVVMSLLTSQKSPTNMRAVRAFGTPTVVHFSMALLVSAILLAPWNAFGLEQGTPALSNVLLLCALLCALYIVRTIWHARAATYDPDVEDWIWYIVMPLLAYLLLGVSAYAIRFLPVHALFGLGAASASLLFIGIHNAWDTVTYISTKQGE